MLVVEGEESWEKGGRELRVEENFGKALGVDLRQWGGERVLREVVKTCLGGECPVRAQHSSVFSLGGLSVTGKAGEEERRPFISSSSVSGVVWFRPSPRSGSLG